MRARAQIGVTIRKRVARDFDRRPHPPMAAGEEAAFGLVTLMPEAIHAGIRTQVGLAAEAMAHLLVEGTAEAVVEDMEEAVAMGEAVAATAVVEAMVRTSPDAQGGTLLNMFL